MPTSAMAATAAGLIDSAGTDPAERTSIRSPASADRKPAAIWDRPALWTHTNSTVGRCISDLLLVIESAGGGAVLAGRKASSQGE